MSVATIATIGKVIRGVSWDKADASDSSRSDYLPILRAVNIGNGLNTEEDLVWVPSKNVSADQKIRAGDIAICMSSGSPAVVGKTAVSPTDWTGSVGAFCAIVRANPAKCLPEYLAFFLKSPRFRKWTSEAQGANIKNIKKSSLEGFEIWLPPLPEQRRIVDLLSRAEGIVRLRREAEKKAAELIPALFLDMFGDPATNPQGWPVENLDSVAQIISGATKGRRFAPNDAIEVPYMRVANVKDGYLDLTEIKTITVKRNEVERFRLLPGDLLLTEGGDPDKLGRGALWAGEIETCLHQNHIFKVRADRSRLVPEYLCELAASRYGKAYFLRVAKKTTGIASINKTQLGKFPVVIPPLDKQQAFGERLRSVRSIQFQQSTATTKAQATVDALRANVFENPGTS